MSDFLTCHYCGRGCDWSPTSDHLYRGTDYGPVWECKPCEAWVGCHQYGSKPYTKTKGTPANRYDRARRRDAHAAFDKLWKLKMRREGVSKRVARAAGYAWLAEELGLTLDECHIGMMHGRQLELVVWICTPPFGRKDKAHADV